MKQNSSGNIRKGRFLWMDSEDQNKYLSELTRKITSDFFCSDQVLSKIVEDLAPVFCDCSEIED
ncbi:hypothetical protein CHISP_0417 [Chitinispirillum alkaliphilum]|nr:hypothetical protein CHISP_0417 [Chitinispirillum alkaliphilum]